MGLFRAFALCTWVLIEVQALTETSLAKVNPIRKVVSMLQLMQQKVEAEGVKEKALFDKFMCYCKNSGGDLQASISAAEAKIPEVGSDIEEATNQKAQLEEDVKKAKAARAAAKTAISDAAALRKKEAAAFAEETDDLKTNLAAVQKAVAALEKGMAGLFVQTKSAMLLRKLANSAVVQDTDRQELISFLSGSTSFAPQSGQITGILKQMGDTMAANLADATKVEDEAIATFKKIIKAKSKEVAALQAAIESKSERVGELGVKIVQMKEDLSDTEEALLNDKKFLAELEKGCKTKEEEWAVIQKTRTEELVALADTIKVLNDDDALELFKKTLPSGASFMQIQVAETAVRRKALSILDAVRSTRDHDRYRLDFIMLAVRGKKIGFKKVIGMIDDMVALLGKEQGVDDDKRESCLAHFDSADDKHKALTRKHGQLETAIDEATEAIATTSSEIAALKASITGLDANVVTETKLRKEEHADFKDLVASDSAAKDLLEFAKNRLNKFYNPKLYKAPPKKELTGMDRSILAAGGSLETPPPPGGIAGTGISFVQVKAHSRGLAAPPPPPEAPGAYEKKTGEGTGVIQMIDLLIKEMTTELTEAKKEEELANEDYKQMMADSAAKRAADVKTLSNKEGTKASLEEALAKHTEGRDATAAEIAANEEHIAALHGDCDWLLKYYPVRKQARTGEVESLKNAKAVLSGADYSLMQTHSSHFLSRQ